MNATADKRQQKRKQRYLKMNLLNGLLQTSPVARELLEQAGIRSISGLLRRKKRLSEFLAPLGVKEAGWALADIERDLNANGCTLAD